MFDRTQLMKGTLEGCILLIIGRETTYGYEIMEKLIQYGFCGIREGTIYPQEPSIPFWYGWKRRT